MAEYEDHQVKLYFSKCPKEPTSIHIDIPKYGDAVGDISVQCPDNAIRLSIVVFGKIDWEIPTSGKSLVNIPFAINLLCMSYHDVRVRLAFQTPELAKEALNSSCMNVRFRCFDSIDLRRDMVDRDWDIPGFYKLLKWDAPSERSYSATKLKWMLR